MKAQVHRPARVRPGFPAGALVVVTLACSILTRAGSFAQPVTIPDPGLEAAFREAFRQPSGPLTIEALQTLSYLDASRRGIVSLEGLPYASQLTELNLSENLLTDLDFPAGLTNLFLLSLKGNGLTALTLPADQGALGFLNLNENYLTATAFLAGLTNLVSLELEYNELGNLECPGIGPPINQPAGWYYTGWGYAIGYNYLGGHTNTPWPRFHEFQGWVSPQHTTDDPSLVLVTDLNDWSPGYGKSFAPHGSGGPILKEGDFSNPSADGASSAAIGAVGGNVGLLDGSVSWKPIGEMKPYRGSRLWGSGGCFAVW